MFHRKVWKHPQSPPPQGRIVSRRTLAVRLSIVVAQIDTNSHLKGHRIGGQSLWGRFLRSRVPTWDHILALWEIRWPPGQTTLQKHTENVPTSATFKRQRNWWNLRGVMSFHRADICRSADHQKSYWQVYDPMARLVSMRKFLAALPCHFWSLDPSPLIVLESSCRLESTSSSQQGLLSLLTLMLWTTSKKEGSSTIGNLLPTLRLRGVFWRLMCHRIDILVSFYWWSACSVWIIEQTGWCGYRMLVSQDVLVLIVQQLNQAESAVLLWNKRVKMTSETNGLETNLV